MIYIPKYKCIIATFSDGYKNILVYDDYDTSDKFIRFFDEVDSMIAYHGNVKKIEEEVHNDCIVEF